MLVRDVMSARVAAIAPGEPVAEAAQIMKLQDVGSLPVIDTDGHVIGLITDRDIVTRCDLFGRSTLVTRVVEIMSEGVVSCYEDEAVTTVARAMSELLVRRLPVVRRLDHRLVGMLSIDDLAEHLRVQPFVERILAATGHHASTDASHHASADAGAGPAVPPAALEALIRERAYALWDSRGRPEGRDAEHWAHAEAEVLVALAKAQALEGALIGDPAALDPQQLDRWGLAYHGSPYASRSVLA